MLDYVIVARDGTTVLEPFPACSPGLNRGVTACRYRVHATIAGERQHMTPQQHFLHRRALDATAWFCRTCGEPPRQPAGLCDRCMLAESKQAGEMTIRRSTVAGRAP